MASSHERIQERRQYSPAGSILGAHRPPPVCGAKNVILADLLDVFPDGIRERGMAYFRSGAVRITQSSADSVTAVVRGSKRYDAAMEVRKSRLALFCSCPFFFSDRNCKHLWATVLAADQAGLLRRLPAFDEIAEVAGVDPEAVDGDFYEEDLDDEPRAASPARVLRAPAPPRRATAPLRRSSQPPAAPPPWKLLLEKARGASPPKVAQARPLRGELVYVVDVEKTLSGNLTLFLLERGPRKESQKGPPEPVPDKLKPAKILLAALDSLPDERDRRALPILQGMSTIGDAASPYSAYAYSPGGYQRCFSTEIQLSLAAADVVMPLLSDTGRLLVRKRDGELVPARYDGGEPWELLLRFCRRHGRASTTVEGALRRGEESLALSEPLVLTAEGWVVFSDRISRFQHFGCFGLVSVLRQHHEILVPAREQKAFVAELVTQPGLPRLELPEELRLREISTSPRPNLAIGRPRPSRPLAPGDRLLARLVFSYQDHSLEATDPRLAVALPDEGILIRRDREAELAAAARLAALGFRPARLPYAPPDAGSFDIAAKKVPTAVSALLAEGWHVEAEGKPYRTAGHFDLAVTSGVDWFDLSATVDFGGVRATLPELLRALGSGERMIVLGDGSLGMLPEAWLAKYGPLASMGTLEGDRVRFRGSQAGLLDALLAAQPEASVDRVFAKARKELARFEGVRPQKAPPGFEGELRPYQEVGVGWLEFLRRFGFGGCLADDMGLGKTVQILAMLEGRRATGKPVSLVVVPKSLVWNWQQESARFTPRLSCRAHVGAGRATTAKALAAADLVLTTYGTLRSDIELLRQIKFDYVILDEAQAIKNSDSESAKAARLLRGCHRLALSGTPVENHLGELWSLFEFLNPGMLGAARAFEGATRRGRPNPETVAILGRALRPFILRRTKRAVAPELPAKHEETILCELDPPQRRLYTELRDHYRGRLLGKVGDLRLGKNKIQVLEALLRLRQAACHPGLIDKRRGRETCAKLDVLLPRLEELRAEGHKALVFSQFTSFLALLRARLDAQKIPYEYLDGAVEDRAERVARFQTDPNCPLFLISLKAGGTGLNLTAADYVFILDPWWNPAVEAQAVDRTHRIGQGKQVFVYRLLSRDTVEEKVAALQESKRGLAESIINSSGTILGGLDRETLEALLS